MFVSLGISIYVGPASREEPIVLTFLMMVEMTKMGSLVVLGKYYSSVKSSGEREVLEI
jgi:hypothetical protein